MLGEIFNSINPLLSDYEVYYFISPQGKDIQKQVSTWCAWVKSDSTSFIGKGFLTCGYIGKMHIGRLWTKRTVALLPAACALIFILISLGIIPMSTIPIIQLSVGIGGATLLSTISLLYLGALAHQKYSLHRRVGHGSYRHQLYFSDDIFPRFSNHQFFHHPNSKITMAIPMEIASRVNLSWVKRQTLETKYVW